MFDGIGDSVAAHAGHKHGVGDSVVLNPLTLSISQSRILYFWLPVCM